MYPRLFELGPITVYTYGLLLAAAYLLGLKLAMVRAKARGLDANRVLDLGIYIIISALLGAKLLLLVTDFKTFTANPRELLTLARSGGVFSSIRLTAIVTVLSGFLRSCATTASTSSRALVACCASWKRRACSTTIAARRARSAASDRSAIS